VSSWYLVTDGDRQVRVAVATGAGATWVFVNGNVWKIEDPTTERVGRKGRGDSSVMAPMPATVVTIHTAPGQPVSEGDTVIVLEAMKMEMPIRAPRSGVVSAVHCRQGELVQPGVNLIEIA
jgi:3-methylcrotonyl-CoA carboxylase alpha subunit